MSRRSRPPEEAEPAPVQEETTDWPTPWVKEKRRGRAPKGRTREPAPAVERPARQADWPGPASVGDRPRRQADERSRTSSDTSRRALVVAAVLVLLMGVGGFIAGASGEQEGGDTAKKSRGAPAADAAAADASRRSRELQRALERFDARRSSGRRRLARARTRREQAVAAGALARAHDAAARSLPAGPGDRLRPDLEAAASAYRRLGRSARRGNRRAYRRARSAVARRDLALRRAVGRLSS